MAACTSFWLGSLKLRFFSSAQDSRHPIGMNSYHVLQISLVSPSPPISYFRPTSHFAPYPCLFIVLIVWFLFFSERPSRKISVNDLDEELCKMSSEKRHVERMVRYLSNNLSYVLPRERILSALSAQLNSSSVFEAFRPRRAQ